VKPKRLDRTPVADPSIRHHKPCSTFYVFNWRW